MSGGCCDQCPYSPSCDEDADYNCSIGIHQWGNRGTDADRWRECWLCREVEDEDEDQEEGDRG